MPNWSSNTLVIRGKKNDVVDFLLVGLNQQKVKLTFDLHKSKAENIAKTLNEGNKKQILSLRSWMPMPKTFIEWDTTNQLQSFDSWLEHIGKHTRKIAKHFGFAMPQNAYTWTEMNEYIWGDFRAEMDKVQPKPYYDMIDKEKDDYEKLCAELKAKFVQPKLDELQKLFGADYDAYCKGYEKAKKLQEKKYGIVGWYDYNLKTLGTKWNADFEGWIVDELENGDLLIRVNCETAWSFPEMWVITIANEYPNLAIAMYASEESYAYNGFFDARKPDWIENIGESECDELYKKAEKQIKKEHKGEKDFSIEDYDTDVFDLHHELMDEQISDIYEHFMEYIHSNEFVGANVAESIS